jgi:hypothetical protein
MAKANHGYAGRKELTQGGLRGMDFWTRQAQGGRVLLVSSRVLLKGTALVVPSCFSEAPEGAPGRKGLKPDDDKAYAGACRAFQSSLVFRN